MLKILFADPYIIGETIGGAEVQLWLLASGFVNAGWEVHYLTNARLAEKKRNGVILHSMAHTEKKRFNSAFFDIIESLNPDVIYQRGRKSYTGLIGQYAHETSTPFIFSTSMDIDCRRFKELGRIAGQKKNLLDKLRLVPHRYKQDQASLKGMKQATLVLAQSHLQQEMLNRNLSINSTVFRNLHPAPDEESIIKDTPALVLWLASVKQWKRPELFIELARSFKNHNCKFILAGRMADSNRYARLIKEFNEENPDFQYIENVDLDESNLLISRASVFINTSEPYEGFPNTFIQSWLRRTVTLSLGVDPDNLLKAKNIGISCSNIANMKSRLADLLENQNKLLEMGKRAREFAIDEFGFENNFSTIESHARKLVNSAR